MASGTEYERVFQTIEERSPDKAAVIRQYQRVARAFNEMLEAIDAKTDGAAWKKDGVGSCRVSPHLFETYLDGVVTGDIERLWDAKDADNPDLDESDNRRCQFHRIGTGCILGDLKSPRCLSHIDGNNVTEIETKLGTKLPEIKQPLLTIQLGGMDVTGEGCVLHPDLNDKLVEDTVQSATEFTAKVRELPTIS